MKSLYFSYSTEQLKELCKQKYWDALNWRKQKLRQSYQQNSHVINEEKQSW